MSTRKGGGKKGAPAYQNKFAFRHNPNSKKTAKILSLPNEGLCNKCHDIVEWRKKFRKYKPLTTPKKCVKCEQKAVTRAYHIICANCAKNLKICAKCLQSKDIVTPIMTAEDRKNEERYLREKLAEMTERERRSFFRSLERDTTDEEKKPSKADGKITLDDSDDEFALDFDNLDDDEVTTMVRQMKQSQQEKNGPSGLEEPLKKLELKEGETPTDISKEQLDITEEELQGEDDEQEEDVNEEEEEN